MRYSSSVSVVALVLCQLSACSERSPSQRVALPADGQAGAPALGPGATSSGGAGGAVGVTSTAANAGGGAVGAAGASSSGGAASAGSASGGAGAAGTDAAGSSGGTPAGDGGSAGGSDTASGSGGRGGETNTSGDGETTSPSASTPGATTSEPDAGAPEPCVVDHGGEVPSLRQLYADHFAIGAAIDTQYQNYAGLLTKHFNSVTAEDQMKFDALQPSEGNFTFGTADQMVDFAVSNGMQVRGHALVWHRQTPAWVFSGSREQVLQRMKDHISNVMQHFQGRVQVWDVVNEAIMDDGSYRTANEEEGQQSGWYGSLGEDYIAEAFIAAREADPTAKLFYNDYYNYHPARRQAIYEMLAGLLEDGVPIDGVGIQCHLNLEPGTDPNEQSYHQTVENLETAIEMYASLGLDVQVTELDLSVYLRGIQYTPDMFYTPATFTPEVQQQQAERYREFFEMFRQHSDVISSVSWWGIADDNTWLSEFDSGRQDFPLLFDAQQQPKPAFWAVSDFCD